MEEIVPTILDTEVYEGFYGKEIYRTFKLDNKKHFNDSLNGFRLNKDIFLKETEFNYLKPIIDRLFAENIGVKKIDWKKLDYLGNGIGLNRNDDYFAHLDEVIMKDFEKNVLDKDAGLVSERKLEYNKKFTIGSRFLRWRDVEGFQLGFYVPPSSNLLTEHYLFNHENEFIRAIQTSSQIKLRGYRDSTIKSLAELKKIVTSDNPSKEIVNITYEHNKSQE